MRNALLAVIPLMLCGARARPGEGALCPEHRGELRAVSADMEASRDALGAERHGTELQERQKRILDRLDRLIAGMEKPPPPPPDCPPSPPEPPPPGPPPCNCPFCRKPPPPPGEPPHGPRCPGDPGDPGDPRSGPPGPGDPRPGKPAAPRPDPQNPAAPAGKQPTTPAEREFATAGTTGHGPKAGLSAIGARWGELPPKVRGAIQASESARLPEKYRRLVEFYLVTISEERRR